MAENSPAPLGSSEHHQPLLVKVGDWKVSCKYLMDPVQEVVVEGTEHVEALGETWLVGRFQTEVMGKPIHGLATQGYDTLKGKYVGTWQDSSTPYFYYFEGALNDDTLLLEGDNIDPTSSQLTLYRSVETIEPDKRTLQLFIVPSESESIPILEYEYVRI